MLILFSTLLTIAISQNTIRVDGENIDKLLRDNEYMFLKFYSPSCPFCEKMAPHFTLAAQMLLFSYPQLKFGLVDCTMPFNILLCFSFEIEAYPTLRLYSRVHEMKGSTISKETQFKPIEGYEWEEYRRNFYEYQEGRDYKQIVNWIKKKIQQTVVYVETQSQLDQIIQIHQVVLTLYESGCKNWRNRNLFDEFVNKTNLMVYFAKTNNLKNYRCQIVLHKKFNDHLQSVIFEDDEELENFVKTNMYPLVIQINDQNIHFFQDQSLPKVLLITSIPKTQVDFSEVANKFRKQFLFGSTQFQSESIKMIEQILGEECKYFFLKFVFIVQNDSIIIIETPIRKIDEDTVFLSYQLIEEELNVQTMSEFLQDYLSGNFEEEAQTHAQKRDDL